MIPYIINAGIILAGCLIFYKILLRKETFYRVNRYLLVCCLLVSFGLPLVRIPQQWSLRKTEEKVILNNQPATKPEVTKQAIEQAPQSVPVQQTVTPSSSGSFPLQKTARWLIYLYWFGVIAFGANFLLQIVLLLYRAYTKPVIIDGHYRIVEVSGDKAPCSFANNIFINPEKYEWDTYNQVLLHEKVHIQQRHTLDIVLAEIVLIFQWYNPFAWIYRKEIENNLEFLTDAQLVEKEAVEKTSYQLNLLQVSAPHFPLSITTNYNQSLLKKRIAMMNMKKSNVHTVWKYFFLLPVLVLFAALLNEPVVYGQTKPAAAATEKPKSGGMDTEGSWFATIKNDRINFQFKNDDEDHGFNNSSFNLGDFPNLPRGTAGTFKIMREAGTMEFTGKFEDNQGMGRYKFIADHQYGDQMSSDINEKLDDRDLMVFFFIDIKKSHVQMLKGEGYSKIDKDQLIPLVALKVDQPFIRSLKESGFKDVTLEKLIPLKSLGIDGSYVKEIRNAGFPDITADQLITFKAQGIDGKYVDKMRKSNNNGNDNSSKNELNADDIVTWKAMDIDEEYVNSFKSLGLKNLKRNDLVSMKSLGITPEFVKGFQSAGYTNITPDELIPLKAQDITPAYIKGFEVLGEKNISLQDAISLKGVGATPEYAKSFATIGYNQISVHDLIPLKAQRITPEFIKGFETVGYKNIPIDEIISLKAVGVTPEYIKSMKEKGFNYDRVSKYISLKSIE